MTQNMTGVKFRYTNKVFGIILLHPWIWPPFTKESPTQLRLLFLPPPWRRLLTLSSWLYAPMYQLLVLFYYFGHQHSYSVAFYFLIPSCHRTTDQRFAALTVESHASQVRGKGEMMMPSVLKSMLDKAHSAWRLGLTLMALGGVFYTALAYVFDMDLGSIPSIDNVAHNHL